MGWVLLLRLRIATIRTPDFVTRYPSLLTKPVSLGVVCGWDIAFNWTGIPFSWTPLSAMEVAGIPLDQPRILEANAALLKRERSKSLAVARGSSWSTGKDLDIVLQQLFGVR